MDLWEADGASSLGEAVQTLRRETAGTASRDRALRQLERHVQQRPEDSVAVLRSVSDVSDALCQLLEGAAQQQCRDAALQLLREGGVTALDTARALRRAVWSRVATAVAAETQLRVVARDSLPKPERGDFAPLVQDAVLQLLLPDDDDNEAFAGTRLQFALLDCLLCVFEPSSPPLIVARFVRVLLRVEAWLRVDGDAPLSALALRWAIQQRLWQRERVWLRCIPFLLTDEGLQGRVLAKALVDVCGRGESVMSDVAVFCASFALGRLKISKRLKIVKAVPRFRDAALGCLTRCPELVMPLIVYAAASPQSAEVVVVPTLDSLWSMLLLQGATADVALFSCWNDSVFRDASLRALLGLWDRYCLPFAAGFLASLLELWMCPLVSMSLEQEHRLYDNGASHEAFRLLWAIYGGDDAFASSLMSRWGNDKLLATKMLSALCSSSAVEMAGKERVVRRWRAVLQLLLVSGKAPLSVVDDVADIVTGLLVKKEGNRGSLFVESVVAVVCDNPANAEAVKFASRVSDVLSQFATVVLESVETRLQRRTELTSQMIDDSGSDAQVRQMIFDHLAPLLVLRVLPSSCFRAVDDVSCRVVQFLLERSVCNALEFEQVRRVAAEVISKMHPAAFVPPLLQMMGKVLEKNANGDEERVVAVKGLMFICVASMFMFDDVFVKRKEVQRAVDVVSGILRLAAKHAFLEDDQLRRPVLDFCSVSWKASCLTPGGAELRHCMLGLLNGSSEALLLALASCFTPEREKEFGVRERRILGPACIPYLIHAASGSAGDKAIVSAALAALFPVLLAMQHEDLSVEESVLEQLVTNVAKAVLSSASSSPTDRLMCLKILGVLLTVHAHPKVVLLSLALMQDLKASESLGKAERSLVEKVLSAVQ